MESEHVAQLTQLLQQMPTSNGSAALHAQLQETVWAIVSMERRRAADAEDAAEAATKEARLLHETLQASLRVQEDTLTTESRATAQLTGDLEMAKLDAEHAQSELVALQNLVSSRQLQLASTSSASQDTNATDDTELARRFSELQQAFSKAQSEKDAALAEAKQEKLRAEWALAALEAIVEEIASVRQQATTTGKR